MLEFFTVLLMVLTLTGVMDGRKGPREWGYLEPQMLPGEISKPRRVGVVQGGVHMSGPRSTVHGPLMLSRKD